MNLLQASFLVAIVGSSDAWTTPLTHSNSPLQRRHGKLATTTLSNAFSKPPRSTTGEYEVIDLEEASSTQTDDDSAMMAAMPTSLLCLAALAASPETASAAVTDTITAASTSTIVTAGGSIPSALFAYGHYFSVIGMVAILVTERLTLENGPNLTEGEENRLAIADTLYGVVALLLIYTGYYRFSDPSLGKGSYFYIHEPIFWLKIALLGVVGSASLFNTTKIIQRSVSRFSGDKTVEPMSEELCNRMKSICNAQLTGILFIPMAATFMARGIGYDESIPWQAEAAGALVIFLGLSFKYVKEALTFEARLAEKQ